MNDKKNIDRLFQEKFKDFEMTPDEQVWPNIEAVLHPKKKRRIVPFWWQFGGVAAGLILGFFALNSLLNEDIPDNGNQVVIEEVGEPNTNPSVPNDPNSNIQNNGSGINTAPVSIENEPLVQSEAESSNKTSASDLKKGATPTNASSRNNAVVGTKTNQTKNPSLRKNNVNNNRANPREALANQSQSEKPGNAADPKSVNPIKNPTVKQSVAVQHPNASEQQKKAENGNIANSKAPVENGVFNKPISNQEKIASNIATEKMLYDQKDSTAVATVEEPNALEILLQKNEKEEQAVAEAKVNRWQVTPNVAPIYFSSTSNGSPIDAQFANNSKSYENNMSYGVGINYAISKKISLRTGINTFTLGYDTNDVILFAALDQATFANVASSASGSTIQVISRNNFSAMDSFDSSIQNTSQGIMTQRMGYLEVPLEMSYKLVDQKFGVQVIGGLSTLFLNDNEVTVSSNTMSASLGRARNLNDIHFSTNIGFGFKYRFWKSFEANFEPMFKYQINTFNKDAGNFKPYFIGLYSGVSFNF